MLASDARDRGFESRLGHHNDCKALMGFFLFVYNKDKACYNEWSKLYICEGAVFMPTILIAEDDLDILELLTLYLESNQYNILTAKNGEMAWEVFQRESVDLLLVDIIMPKMNGYNLIRKVREISNVPIIVLSAKNNNEDKILGLNLGADAYITKPFNPLEVVAYVQASLRRSSFGEKNKLNNRVIQLGQLVLDLDEYILRKNNQVIPITRTEFMILAKMMQQPKRIFTKAQLYECINGEYFENDENTMMVHISNIRSKIEDDPSNPKYLITVRGLGYKIEDEEE